MIVVELIYNLSVLVALSVLSGFIGNRFKRTELKGKVFQGLLFGFTAIVGMLYPFTLAEGIIFDGRSIVISLCTFFFGTISGMIAALIAILYRIHIGGGGMVMGVLVIASSFIIGYIYYIKRQKQEVKELRNTQLYVFGLLVHIVMLIFVLALPSQKIVETYQTLTLTIIGVYPLVSLLIGKILYEQEEKHSILEKIQSSEEKYRLLVDNQTDLIVKTDPGGKILFANPAYCFLFDKTEEDLIGKLYTPLVHEDDLPEVKKAVAELFFPPYRCSYQERANTKFGWRWIEWEAKAVLENGRVTALIGAGRDITERKIAEIKLKESEEKYRILIENTHALLFSTDTKGRFTYLNEAAANTLGSTVEKMLGRFYLKFVHPDDRKAVHEAFSRQLVHTSPDHFTEFRFVSQNGQTGWLKFLVNPVLINNQTTGLTGVALNITESKLAEEELTKLKRAIEQSSVSIVITNKNGDIEYVNPFFTKLTGYSFEEVKGKNPRLLKSNLHSPAFYKKLWEDITQGKDWIGEIYNIKKNGEAYWENTIISPIVNKQGNITHYVAIQEDVTEKKKLVEDLTAAKEKAEEMNKVKSVFFANMSHELRTPMIGILGNAELLELDIKDEEHLGMVKAIRKSALRLHETLNSILDISKIEVEGVSTLIRKVEVNDVIEESIALFRAAAVEKGLKINFIKNTKNITLNTDDNLLAKILNNLISNAIKYSDSGYINVTSSLHNGYAIIEIEDTGIGIDQENLNLIFEPFRQTSEGYSRRYEGTGLGLTITKKFVEVLGGSINVRSKKGKGSVFTIYIPDNKINNQKNFEMTGEKDNSVFNTNQLVLKKILLVEDEMINAEVILKLLEGLYVIDWVRFGQEAIAKARNNKYDAILMDIGLQGDIDGLETAKEILKSNEYKNIPIIAVTAYAMEGDKEKFLQSGCTHYISKPFNKAELIKIISQAFNDFDRKKV